MKNEKICISQKVAILSVVVLFLTAIVILTNYISAQKVANDTKAAGMSALAVQTACRARCTREHEACVRGVISLVQYTNDGTYTGAVRYTQACRLNCSMADIGPINSLNCTNFCNSEKAVCTRTFNDCKDDCGTAGESKPRDPQDEKKKKDNDNNDNKVTPESPRSR